MFKFKYCNKFLSLSLSFILSLSQRKAQVETLLFRLLPQKLLFSESKTERRKILVKLLYFSNKKTTERVRFAKRKISTDFSVIFHVEKNENEGEGGVY
jgi:hypothetical protein